MPQEDSGVRVDVGVGVLGLSVLGEDAGHDLVDGGDDLEELVVGHVLEGELPLARVPGVGLAEDGVAVSGDDLLGVEGVPGELGDGLGVDLLALIGHLLLDALDPSEDLLVGESVKGAGEGVEASRVGEVRVREGGSDEVGGVGGGVSSLVVGVDAEVEAHELVEALVVVAKHSAEVSGVVEAGVLADDSVEVDVPVDGGRDLGELSDDVEDVLEDVLMVFGLGGSLLVGLGEGAAGLGGVEANGELGHGVHVLGEAVEEGNDVAGEARGALVEVGGEAINLGLGGDLRGEEEPEEGLEEGLSVLGTGGAFEGGEDLLAVGDGVAAEPDSLLGVEVGGLPEHALDSTGSSDALVDGDLSQNLVSVLLLEGEEVGLLLRDLRLEDLLDGSDAPGVTGERAAGKADFA
mmetsp:Transcript_24868/g.46760  ORF Transcript_24868/g.46760 Transcript_24868/m.46760 type:complete len:406 (+) Transcript_24868:283-1500(+)